MHRKQNNMKKKKRKKNRNDDGLRMTENTFPIIGNWQIVQSLNEFAAFSHKNESI